jgi:hypothetical protein
LHDGGGYYRLANGLLTDQSINLWLNNNVKKLKKEQNTRIDSNKPEKKVLKNTIIYIKRFGFTEFSKSFCDSQILNPTF